jgi:hypothetical protein
MRAAVRQSTLIDRKAVAKASQIQILHPATILSSNGAISRLGRSEIEVT